MKTQFITLAVTASLACGQATAALVAYFPIDSATDSSTFIDDIIDDASHGAANGTTTSNSGSIIFDATRGGDVISTVQGHRYTAGTQDINLAVGFTWSLWFKSDSVANADAGSDVIIGSRSGSWNKLQANGASRFFGHSYSADDDTWHHIVYTGIGDGLSGTTLSNIWIDGVKISTDSNGSQGNATIENTKLEIGGTSLYTEDWTGLIDDIAIWDEVISDSDIAALYAGTNPQLIGVPEPNILVLLSISGVMLICRRRS